jgi:hypothetical protein
MRKEGNGPDQSNAARVPSESWRQIPMHHQSLDGTRVQIEEKREINVKGKQSKPRYAILVNLITSCRARKKIKTFLLSGSTIVARTCVSSRPIHD